MDARMKEEAGIYDALRRIFVNRKEISRLTKILVLRRIHISILIYRTWVMNTRSKDKIQAVRIKYFREVLGMTRLD